MPETPLVRLRLDSAFLPPAAQWAGGLDAKLPVDMAVALWEGAFVKSAGHAFDAKVAANMRDRRAYLKAPPGSARLPVSYQAVPGPLRRVLAGAYGRVQRFRSSRWADFPGWPLDLSADIAADLLGPPSVSFATTPVLLTHDLDSPEGLVNLVDMFLSVEEAVGARSANYIVPCAWPIDDEKLKIVQARGHEIGVHGYDHSNKTSFLGPQERKLRLDAGRAFADRYQASGYRAPSLVRSEALIEALTTRYRYDSSIPTSGGLFPVPNNGCASARPWRIGGMWELPLSMPRDGSLRFLGHGADDIAELWWECAKAISRSRGVVVLLTHCERGFSGNPPMLAAYRRFLAKISDDSRFQFMRPVDLVDLLDRKTHS